MRVGSHLTVRQCRPGLDSGYCVVDPVHHSLQVLEAVAANLHGRSRESIQLRLLRLYHGAELAARPYSFRIQICAARRAYALERNSIHSHSETQKELFASVWDHKRGASKPANQMAVCYSSHRHSPSERTAMPGPDFHAQQLRAYLSAGLQSHIAVPRWAYQAVRLLPGVAHPAGGIPSGNSAVPQLPVLPPGVRTSFPLPS